LSKKLECEDNNDSQREYKENPLESEKNQKKIRDSNQNKIELNRYIQDFPILDLNKLESNRYTGQKVLKFEFNTYNINTNKLIIQQQIDRNQILSKENLNILIVDDEVLTRQSTKRVLQNISKSLKIELNIFEAEDGIETIFLVYKCITQGIKISMIISDENMRFMYGSRSAEILEEIVSKNRIAEIPFYLLTAYDNILIEKYISSRITQILTKPLTKNSAKILLINAIENLL
jgi:CheY-like chemotaxis protein